MKIKSGNCTCNPRISGKVPVMEYGFTWPTASLVASHNTWKPRDSRLHATPDDASSNEISILELTQIYLNNVKKNI